MVRMKVITVANRKGGTAKTTTVVNLAYGFAQAGKRVMVIDLDNQGHVMHGLKALGCAPQNEVTELPISLFFYVNFEVFRKHIRHGCGYEQSEYQR